MEIELSNLRLDRQNERFTDLSFITNNDDEEVIFKYLRDYEELDSMITSIQSAGFHKLGERPVVVLEQGQYVVLEGNRRICALKALHGMYSLKFPFNEIYVRETHFIDVDLAASRESVSSFLASRHIEGLRMWKPEAKRNFFFKHFYDGKSIDIISKMTAQKPNEIKKLLADSIFLEEFKRRSQLNKIQQPSILYDRISKYFEDMKIVHEVNVASSFKDSKVLFNTNIPDNVIDQFFFEVGQALYGPEKFIDSRNANTFKQFQELFQEQTRREKFPNLVACYDSIIQYVNRSTFIPIQKIFSSVRGRVPKVNEIIYFDPIKDSAPIRIIDEDVNLISENQFILSKSGSYQIVVNEVPFTFIIQEYAIPEIIVDEDSLQSLMIRNTIDISKSILIHNEFSESVKLHSDNISVISLSSEVVVNDQKQIVINVAGKYSLEIQYSSKLDQTLKASKYITITGVPDSLESKVPQEIAFFDFKIVNVSEVEKYTLAGSLLFELEHAHKSKHYHIFIAALRSLVEIQMNSFFDNVLAKAPTSKYSSYISKNGAFNKLLCFSEIDYKRATDIAEQYRLIKPDNLKSPLTIVDYFNSHLTEKSLKAMWAILNLGAHQSLSHLFIQDIETVQPTVIALLEYMCIIEAISFKY